MSIGFSCITGLDDLLDHLKNIGADIEKAAIKTIEQTQEQFATKAKENAPVDWGYLREQIHAKPVEELEDGTYSGEVVSGAEYGAYVEFGTGQRGYAANEDKDLFFTWRKQGEDGEWYDFMGMKPQPYFEPALAEMKHKFKDNAVEFFVDELKR